MIYPDESLLMAPAEWRDSGADYRDIYYHKSSDSMAKITPNRT